MGYYYPAYSPPLLELFVGNQQGIVCSLNVLDDVKGKKAHKKKGLDVTWWWSVNLISFILEKTNLV
jgi:hypothetical protein